MFHLQHSHPPNPLPLLGVHSRLLQASVWSTKSMTSSSPAGPSAPAPSWHTNTNSICNCFSLLSLSCCSFCNLIYCYTLTSPPWK